MKLLKSIKHRYLLPSLHFLQEKINDNLCYICVIWPATQRGEQLGGEKTGNWTLRLKVINLLQALFSSRSYISSLRTSYLNIK